MAAASASPSSGSPRHDGGQGDYAIAHLELNKGKIPKSTSHRIYSQTTVSRFNFWNDYIIKTTGKGFPLNNEYTSLILLTPEIIRKYQKKYAFLHIGLVQVSIQALARLGPNASVTITLRDARHADLKQSILVAFESSVSMDSPINFNLFPDVSYFLAGLISSEALILTVKPHGCDMKECSKHFVMSFRMCYKVMKGTLEPQPLIKGPRLEINTLKSHVLVPIDNGDRVVLQRQKD